MINKIVYIFFFLNYIVYSQKTIVTTSQSCNYEFSGKVIDFHDGSPLAGAIVVSSNSNFFDQTNIEGEFNISNLCQKTYVFEVSHPSCNSIKYSIKISGDTKKNLRLEHHIEELNEVSIYAKYDNEKYKTFLENKISIETIDSYTSGSLGDVLNSLSGVSSFNTGNAIVKPIINGLHSSRVIIINNGVRMEDQEWGAEHAPNIDINSIENLKLIKGAGLLEFSGNALGGIILAESSKIDIKDSIYGKTIFSASSNGKGSTLTSKITKSYSNGWYASAHGTYKRFGDFNTANYVLSNTGIGEKNVSFRIGYNQLSYNMELYFSHYKNETGILRASHSHSAQDQIRAINSSQPLIINNFTYNINAPKQENTHSLIRLKGYKWFKNFGKLSFQYDYQKNRRFEYDIRRGSDKDKPSTDLTLETHALKFDLFSNLNDEIKLKTGIFSRFQKNFPDPKTGVRRIIPDYEKFDLGIYAIVDYILNDNFQLELGGRYDYSYIDAMKYYRISLWNLRNYDKIYTNIIVKELDNQILTNPKFNTNNFSATIGAAYNFKANNKILFNYSLASRFPNPSELFSEGLHHSAARIELGDLKFNSEVGHKLTLNFIHKKNNLNFSLNPFINFINDFILIEPTIIQQTVRGNFQVWEYKQTDAQLAGIDIDLSKILNENFSLQHQFSLVKGYDYKQNEPLINISPVNTRNQISYKNLKLNNLKLVLQNEFVFRQNEYPNNDFEVYIPQTETIELVKLSRPPSAYQLFNFYSSIDFDVFKKSKLNLTFRINNLFNVLYRNYLNRLRYYSHDLGRNFLLNIKLNY